jgi:hypothetical protein
MLSILCAFEQTLGVAVTNRPQVTISSFSVPTQWGSLRRYLRVATSGTSRMLWIPEQLIYYFSFEYDETRNQHFQTWRLAYNLQANGMHKFGQPLPLTVQSTVRSFYNHHTLKLIKLKPRKYKMKFLQYLITTPLRRIKGVEVTIYTMY